MQGGRRGEREEGGVEPQGRNEEREGSQVTCPYQGGGVEFRGWILELG
jgi:hypothetical protein